MTSWRYDGAQEHHTVLGVHADLTLRTTARRKPLDLLRHGEIVERLRGLSACVDGAPDRDVFEQSPESHTARGDGSTATVRWRCLANRCELSVPALTGQFADVSHHVTQTAANDVAEPNAD